MSTKFMVKCDRCGHEQEGVDTPRQFWTVMVNYQSGAFYQHQYQFTRSSAVKCAHWCRTCMSKFGMMETDDAGEKPVTKPDPTMEDLVRAICREEIDS